MHEVRGLFGRLILFRIVPPVADDNSERAAADLRAQILSATGPVIVVSDVSIARVFSPETTARFVALMKSDNPKLLRSALLYSPEAATLGLQVGRMLKEAGNPNRRAFSDKREMVSWLAPLLTHDELRALGELYEGA